VCFSYFAEQLLLSFGLHLSLHSLFLLVSAEELCASDTFTASCSANEAVFIETAFYGRMYNSRCFSMTKNETECVVDFRLEIQKHFGVRQSIRFDLLNEIFTEKKPSCIGERPPSLDITHRCLRCKSAIH